MAVDVTDSQKSVEI